MDKPILFLNNAALSESFTTTKSPPGRIKLPLRERIDHAANLTNRFNDAWNVLGEQRQQRKALSLPSRDGCYIEIIGQAGYELAANSLEDKKSGIRLVSVTKNDAEETQAIVYIPSGQNQILLKKIEDYAKNYILDGNNS